MSTPLDIGAEQEHLRELLDTLTDRDDGMKTRIVAYLGSCLIRAQRDGVMIDGKRRDSQDEQPMLASPSERQDARDALRRDDRELWEWVYGPGNHSPSGAHQLARHYEEQWVKAHREQAKMRVHADMLEACARDLPVGTTFDGGGLDDTPMFDVAMAAVRYMRGEVGLLDQIFHTLSVPEAAAGGEQQGDPEVSGTVGTTAASSAAHHRAADGSASHTIHVRRDRAIFLFQGEERALTKDQCVDVLARIMAAMKTSGMKITDIAMRVADLATKYATKG